MVEDVTDIGVVNTCSECEREFDGYEWVWYARVGGGAAHLTFCQDCGVEGDFELVCRTMPVELIDDRTDESFVRLLNIDEWFDEEERDPKPPMALGDEMKEMLEEMKGTSD